MKQGERHIKERQGHAFVLHIIRWRTQGHIQVLGDVSSHVPLDDLAKMLMLKKAPLQSHCATGKDDQAT
jgi:hypothetical protein